MRCVALLRGIVPANPSMRNEKLRGVLEQLGLRDVQSVISSGNVLFDTEDGANLAELEATIEAAWPAELGFTSMTIVRTRDHLQELIAADPFGGRVDGPDAHLNVTFLKSPLEATGDVPVDPDGGFAIVHVGEQEVCTVIDRSRTRTPDMMRRMEKAYGKQITTRTWKTVHRIVDRMG